MRRSLLHRNASLRITSTMKFFYIILCVLAVLYVTGVSLCAEDFRRSSRRSKTDPVIKKETGGKSESSIPETEQAEKNEIDIEKRKSEDSEASPPASAPPAVPGPEEDLRTQAYTFIGAGRYEKAYFKLKKSLEKKDAPVIMDRIMLDLLRFKLGLEKEFSDNFEDHLRRFRNLIRPDIRKPEFCSEVTSFGNFKRIPDTKITAGSSVLIYCELRNLTAEAEKDRYLYDFTLTGKIATPLGGEVQSEVSLFSSTYTCGSYCTDFFIAPEIRLPETLRKGQKYILTLRLKDNKAGTESTRKKTFVPGGKPIK